MLNPVSPSKTGFFNAQLKTDFSIDCNYRLIGIECENSSEDYHSSFKQRISCYWYILVAEINTRSLWATLNRKL